MQELEPVHLQEDEATGDKFLIYGTDSGPAVEIFYQGDELWMTQAQIAALYGKDASTISRHIGNILDEDELDGTTSLQNMQKSLGRPLTLYSLDMIISVGYRVSSKQATLFRRWATNKLVQFATKGFVVDTARLKSPEYRDRVTELRDIIRDIRSDEANVYRELRSICSMCQDYDGSSDIWQEFYRNTQAKLIYRKYHVIYVMMFNCSRCYLSPHPLKEIYCYVFAREYTRCRKHILLLSMMNR